MDSLVHYSTHFCRWSQKSVLYTSNSLDLSRLYTDEDGYVGILQRPTKFDSDRSKMLEINDFRFNKQPENSYSATTDEPYVYSKHTGKPKHTRIKGGLAHKKKGKLVYTYSPIKPTFLDAQANAGAEIVSTRRPDDLDFRHYLFYGEPEEQLLELEKLIKYTKPKDAASVDYAPHSVGFSKKKSIRRKVMIWRLSDIIEWFQEKRVEKHYAWAIKHMDELPFEPAVINAGEWVKVEENQKVPKTGIYIFLCKGDNHLLYEVYELIAGTDLLWHFQGDRSHTDAWSFVKPLYYYYIPNPLQ